MLPFATLAEVELVADEMLPHYRAIPLIGCLTGLRPSELFGLERRDVDRDRAFCMSVVFSSAATCGPTGRQTGLYVLSRLLRRR